MVKSKTLTVTENKLPAQSHQDEEFFALLPRAESSDFDIPRFTLIQPTSKVEGAPGDIIDSATGQKICGLGQKLVFAPVWFLKDYSVTEVNTQKFRRNEPKTADNAHFSTFDNRVGTDSDGISIERKERLNIFVIQESVLDDDLPRLYRMILKSSSFKESKKLLSEWDIQVRSRLLPFQFLWSVTPKQITNEKGKFVILEFAKEMSDGKQRKVSPEQLEKIKFWVKTLQKNQDKVIKDPSPDEEPQDASLDPVPF